MKFFNVLSLIFDSVSVIPFPFPDSGFRVLVLPLLNTQTQTFIKDVLLASHRTRKSRVFFKVLSSQNFLKSISSPSFLVGSRGMLPQKILENQMLENTFPGILGLETFTFQG